ncbi:SDR family NAD(P)-dependent oxidoreductase [Rhodococcus gannanensis]|uniref:SDR family NAD(P)-dependent oxidoreductase n=1 Tax=Rhodococcus gannanensis TaxID=1960308 RepID=A0ABW4P0X6_9NOCA
MFDLTGKRALLTGGSAGIGLGMARGLAKAGADVVLWGRGQERLDAAAADLAERGSGRVATRSVDVSDEDAVRAGVAAAAREFGGLDVVVVNAGVGAELAKFVESSTDAYRKVLATNLDGAYFTLREAGAELVRQGTGGSVIVTSSLGALQGAARNQAYAMTKAGVLAMANGCAVEFAREGIRVNSVLPGWIATDMTGGLQEWQAFTDNVISRVPLGRWGTPEDFEGIAVYLASDASRFQTGTSTLIDGGYSVF